MLFWWIENSDIHKNKFEALSTAEKDLLAREFIIKNNGTINEDDISSNKKDLKTKSKTINISVKTNTLKLTKDLLAKKKNISEIAKIRNISVDRNSFEDNFEIDSSGTYTLIISTPDSEDIGVVGGIGHVPDSTGVTISIVGFFIIVSGMAGVIVIGFMIIRRRKKKSS